MYTYLCNHSTPKWILSGYISVLIAHDYTDLEFVFSNGLFLSGEPDIEMDT